MIPIPFVQRHASVFATIIAIAVIRLSMSRMALWQQVLAAMVLSVVLWGLLYKRGVTPQRRKGSLVHSKVEDIDPAEPFR